MMTYKHLFAAMLLLASSLLFAQKAPMKFGKLDASETAMTVYAPDSSAAAVILCEYSDLYFSFLPDIGFQRVQTVHRRVKVFKKEAFDLANVAIRYIDGTGDRHYVGSIKASAYNLENGKWVETKMEKSSIIEEKISKNMRAKKFNIPNVKEGTIFEYSYQYEANQMRIPDWTFQDRFPVKWSEYRVSIPEYYTFTFNQEGFNRMHINEKEKDINDGIVVYNYRWAMKDLPALRDEPYTPNFRDYLDKIEFQLAYFRHPNGTVKNLTGTWEKIIEILSEAPNFGERVKERSAIKDLVKELTEGKVTPKDKVLALYNYVTNNIELNPESSWIWAENSLSKVLRNKRGTHAETNILLAAMLQTAGLHANPLLISTRQHGRVTMFAPIYDRFSDVIVHVQLDSANAMLLDANEHFRPAGTLPFAYLNGNGLVIAPKVTPQWVNLHKQKSTDFIDANCQIVDNQLVMGVKCIQKGFSAIQERQDLHKDNNTAESVLRKKFTKLLGTKGTIQKASYENGDNMYESLKSSCELKTNEWGEISDERIYFNPMLIFGISENLFKSPERLFPVDFGEASDKIYNFTFKVPAGYVIEELPKPARLALGQNDVKFDFLVTQNGDEVKIISKLQIKNPIIQAQDYSNLRQFFEQVSIKHNEQIVLKKK